MRGRRLSCLALAAIGVLLSAGPLRAQLVEQPIRIIFPFAAGASGDALARLIALLRLDPESLYLLNEPGGDSRSAARSQRCKRMRDMVQVTMTKLLEKAIAQARALPPEDQDALAAVLLSMTGEGAGIAPLDDETRAAIREGLEQARRGEFVPEAEIKALWHRFGL
jgi:uncharacterized membrane protein